MTDYDINWRTGLRAILRLWPETTPNIADMVSCNGLEYNEADLAGRFRPGKAGERNANDTRFIRLSREALEQAGLAYRDGVPERFRLTHLGECVLSFLGLTGGPRLMNDNNVHLPASLMIRAAGTSVEQRAILMLMRQTDNSLTNDELYQAIGTIKKMSDIDGAAAKIRSDREANITLPESDRNKINPQFLLAGGGGMYITFGDNDKLRKIEEWAVPLIDQCLSESIPLIHASENKETALKMSDHAAPPVDFSRKTFGAATERKVEEVKSALVRHGENSIIALSGVPGTGKTFVALAAAHRFTKSPLLVETIQFHQSYTYEEFIEGLRPTLSGGFEAAKGIFRRWNEQALRDPSNKYVLLIEEFTRANVSSVLGELMTYVEYRDRTFLTPLTRDRLQVAKNLVILVTMNPRDRSALEIDDALIRRMRLLNCPPDTAQLAEMLNASLDKEIGNARREKIIGGLTNLFKKCELKPDYADIMPFGHGIFADIRNEADIEELYNQRIRYLLRRPLRQPHDYESDITTALNGLFPTPTGTETVGGAGGTLETKTIADVPAGGLFGQNTVADAITAPDAEEE